MPRLGRRRSPAWSPAALTTSTTTAGPPLIVYLLGRGASPVQLRDTLPVCFLGLSVVGVDRPARDGHRGGGPGRLAGRPAPPRGGRSGTSRAGRCSPPSCAAARYEGVLTGVLVAIGRRRTVWQRWSDATTLSPMAQAHGDRLTAMDASFLAQEGPNAHMHVGAVTIFEGPPPAFDDFADTCAGGCTSCRATARSWRCRRSRPAGRCGSTTRPSTSSTTCATPRCPAPGSEEQLRALAARIHSQQLDRSKPLWELWLVEGLEDGRFALISKTHHALVDGVAGVDLATVLFDLEPVPPPAPARGRAVGAAARAERGGARRARASSGLVELPFALGGRALRAASQADRDAARRARGGRGPRRGGLGGPEPGARHAAQRADRPAPALRDRPQRAARLQAHQERVRRHGQRRRAGRGRGRAAAAGCARAASAPRASSCGRSCRCRSARPASAAHMGNRLAVDARAAAGLRRGPGRAAAGRHAGDGRAQGVQAGGRRRGARQRAEPRAADDARPGLADQLLHAPVQPDRDQRAGTAVPALRARPRAARTSSPSRSCRATTRWPWRSCPTTAGWTSACSATTTRCRTSTPSATWCWRRATSCWRAAKTATNGGG